MSENIITINGRELSFAPEETILDVAKKNGIFIPTLCHIKGARPTGACRICIVEVEGARAFIPSCSTPAANKMVVHTNSPAVLEARRTVLALLLQSGNHNCSIADKNSLEWSDFQQQTENYDQSRELCPAHSACKLQAYAYLYQADTSGLTRAKTEYPIEMASPLIIRDFSRCIRCGRCVDACNSIQVNNAISHGFRGAESKIIAMGDSSLDKSECVFCGECLQSCPVAALVEKKSRYKIRPWEARHVRTTCHYCGVGCQLVLHIKDDKIMKVTGAEQALPNLGRLCVKGRFGYDFLQSPERMKQPKIRKKGKLRKVSWDEALDLVASKIKEAKQKDGPESIAGICSSKSTNESVYLMQKLFRTAIGSNQLASPQAAAGLNNPIGDLEKTKRILLVGCDITETNPVAGTFIKRAAKNGCQLIVVNSKPTKIGEFANSHLIVKEGTESVLINGFIQELLTRGRKGSEEISNTAKNFSPESVQETTGISKNDMKTAVDILNSHETMMLVYGSSVASAAGAFVNLQEILGNLDKECGGVSFMGDMNNSQGACDMGMSPDYLPGYGRIDDDSARKPFEESWSCTLNNNPGLTFADMISNMNGTGKESGKKINLLYCVGENLVLTEPAFPGIKKALESVDFLIVQDIINNEMTEYADVILPAA
ncbi:MAG: molybdopterin-dependent oxidoreductase, partial [Thermodesulfobacteriota bacterium]|nr:molybdopterin-dependent oxidoreductase [Thermodesulfobacteriota bacterium]